MKKGILFLLLIVFAVSILSAETKLKMEIWNRWTYKMVDGDLEQNELAAKEVISDLNQFSVLTLKVVLTWISSVMMLVTVLESK